MTRPARAFEAQEADKLNLFPIAGSGIDPGQNRKTSTFFGGREDFCSVVMMLPTKSDN
jgi:hypothetical protein